MSDFYGDVIASLLPRVNYLERRISNIEVFDNSFGLPSNLTYYTGTPTASQFAVWTAAGTLAGTTLNTSSFVISQGVAGGQQVAGDTAISGSLHIYGTHYSAGTGNPALTAIYFAPSRGLTPSLSTRMDHDGDWTFTRNVLVQGTATLEDLFVLDKIVHDGDTDTAIRFPSVDTFTIETAGTERARVDSSGLVGVNVSPAGAQLDVVSGDAGRHALRLKAAASPTVPVLEIDDSTSAQVFDVTGAGNVSADGYIRSNVGGMYGVSLPGMVNGETLTVDITTASANNNWQHTTEVTIVLGNTASSTVRVNYRVIVAWSIGTIGTTATVRATDVQINDAQNCTITGATAITNGFRLQFAAGATFSSGRNYMLVNDTIIGNIAIATSVA